jgi:hypothetical protein
MSNIATNNMTSGPHPSEYTRFLHIVMSYDSAEGKYSWQTLDNPALRHQPWYGFIYESKSRNDANISQRFHM